jgi:hypothetical protein
VNIPGLQPSVVAAIPSVFGKWEGAALPFMYTDEKSFVTTGTGNEIDSPAMAIAAGTWHHGDGGPVASPDEVAAGWQTVKDAWPDVQSNACESLTDLRLDQASLDGLLLRTIASFWTTLQGEFQNVDTHPADAQMMLLSNSWAWGPGFPRVWGANGTAFVNAMNARDYATAATIMQAANAHEMTINPGIVPRVQGQAVMLANAALSRSPATLYYPGAPSPSLLAKIPGFAQLGGALAKIPGASKLGTLVSAVPWKSTLALGGVGALAGGPIGLAVGVAAAFGGKAVAPHVAPHFAAVTARVKSGVATVRGKL